MNKTFRILLLYMLTIALLTSFDVTYEWLSPVKDAASGEVIEWYSFMGLRSGAFALGNFDTGPASGLSVNIHAPSFMPFPFYAGAGPEGGGIFVAVWFVGILAFAMHTFLHSRAQRSRPA